MKHSNETWQYNSDYKWTTNETQNTSETLELTLPCLQVLHSYADLYMFIEITEQMIEQTIQLWQI